MRNCRRPPSDNNIEYLCYCRKVVGDNFPWNTQVMSYITKYVLLEFDQIMVYIQIMAQLDFVLQL